MASLSPRRDAPSCCYTPKPPVRIVRGSYASRRSEMPTLSALAAPALGQCRRSARIGVVLAGCQLHQQADGSCTGRWISGQRCAGRP